MNIPGNRDLGVGIVRFLDLGLADVPSAAKRDTHYDSRNHPERKGLFPATAVQSGHPALAVPCGFSQDGLPIGMQLVGRPFDEATILRVAHQYERNTEWRRQTPPVT